MSEYGLTPKGPNIKRLDTIIDEMHDDLSAKWGVNTRQNPQSFINHQLTNIADIVAELWEFGEAIYYSKYPSTAEGSSLDNAAQYGGITRETAKKSYYPIHCTGTDGTKLTAGTMISSKTNPTTYLTIAEEKELTRSSFNKVVIKVASAVEGNRYVIFIDDSNYSITSKSSDSVEILKDLQAIIPSERFVTNIDEENGLLVIEAVSIDTSHTLVLSENLTTDTVTSIVIFGTMETGDIRIPEGVITGITKADAGLLSVINLCSYVPGKNEEKDTEFRQSYADKIFNRSSMMLESIRSAILNNVQGVVSVSPYENDGNEYDRYGRPPHSIEIVVDGGDATQIAKQILNNKAAGISTFGNVAITIPGMYDEDIVVRFNRPEMVYVWVHVGVSIKNVDLLPSNYAELLKKSLLSHIEGLKAGEDIVPQEFVSELYKVCPGINYIDILLQSTESKTMAPDDYTERSIDITDRQRVYTDMSMIEVSVNG